MGVPEYLTPGVYIEEIKIGAKPIEGVSINTAGFLGKTERGPTTLRLITSFSDYERVYGGYIQDSYLTYAIDGFFRNGGKRCFVARIIGERAESASLPLAPEAGTGEALIISAVGSGEWGNRVYVEVKDANMKAMDSKLFKLSVEYYSKGSEPPKAPALLEVYDNLSPEPKLPSYYERIVNEISNLITIKTRDGGRPKNTTKLKLENGKDGNSITVTDYEGKEKEVAGAVERTGLKGFEQIDEISIVCAPNEGDLAPDLRESLIIHCEKLKDRFAILQAEQKDSFNVESLVPERESKYAALYLPWIKIFDPLTKGEKLIPPGGHIAGIYARSDVERGIHKAPANEVVRGAISLQVQITKEEQGILNLKGLNVIRSFPDQGPLVWGARTISTDPLWKYVNVRRLLLFIERSIERGTQWVVFEPNNERLWSRVVATITQFLTRVWRSGALMGTTPDEAFFVKCDRSTMTQDDIDNGRLIVLIGVAPVKPAEFVTFRIAQIKAGAGVTEL